MFAGLQADRAVAAAACDILAHAGLLTLEGGVNAASGGARVEKSVIQANLHFSEEQCQACEKALSAVAREQETGVTQAPPAPAEDWDVFRDEDDARAAPVLGGSGSGKAGGWREREAAAAAAYGNFDIICGHFSQGWWVVSGKRNAFLSPIPPRTGRAMWFTSGLYASGAEWSYDLIL